MSLAPEILAEYQPLIAQIVREVMMLRQKESQTGVSVYEFRGRVLSEKEVAKLAGYKSVRVGAQVVVTPAARDRLKSLGICVERGGLMGRVSDKGVGVLVSDGDGLRRCAFVASQLGQRGFGVRGVGVNDLVKACKEGTSVGFVLTANPQPLVWQMYQAGVCASQIDARDDVTRIVEAMQPRVWVVDLRSQTLATATNVMQRCLDNVAFAKAMGGTS